MSTYLNANVRRTAIEQNRFFNESVFLGRLYLRCCREDIVTACHAQVAGRTHDPIGKGTANEKMDFHELRFTWSDRWRAWVFSGPFYGIALKPTCSRQDASIWLDGLFAAESSSGALHHGPRFAHVLGVEEESTNEALIVSYQDDWVLWRNLGERLYAVCLVEVTAGAEAVELWKLIVYWTVTVPFLRFR